MHCTGNFVLEFPTVNSPILTLTHARAAKLVVCFTDLSCVAAWVISFWNFLADDKFGARACATVRIGEFMLGNSRMKLPDAMHAGQECSVRRGHRLAAVCQCCPCANASVSCLCRWMNSIVSWSLSWSRFHRTMSFAYLLTKQLRSMLMTSPLLHWLTVAVFLFCY